MRRNRPLAPVRGAGLTALAVLVAVGLAGCGGGSTDDADLGPMPDLPTTTPALWNPCGGLDLDTMDERFGTSFSEATGTDSSPQCTFTPDEDGDVALDLNYSLYPGGLDDMFDTFGAVHDGAATTVATPSVDLADDARLVVDTTDGTLAVTGFVQTGDLVQVVNAIQPEPFDEAGVRRGVVAVLADLAAYADAEGAG
ncbi:MAG: hypothetical protein CMH83_15790 [Nocardioides sp.]|nr:hypothetical protein [Nocardioides sp.]